MRKGKITKHLEKFWAAFLMVGLLFAPSFMEEIYGAPPQETTGTLENGPMEDLSIVAISGLGGAVLGLSTLPFEEEPSQHLKHILVGGSLGIIVGVGIIAWNQATRSQDLYQESAQEYPKNREGERVTWHQDRQDHKDRREKKTPFGPKELFIPIHFSRSF